MIIYIYCIYHKVFISKLEHVPEFTNVSSYELKQLNTKSVCEGRRLKRSLESQRVWCVVWEWSGVTGYMTYRTAISSNSGSIFTENLSAANLHACCRQKHVTHRCKSHMNYEQRIPKVTVKLNSAGRLHKAAHREWKDLWTSRRRSDKTYQVKSCSKTKKHSQMTGFSKDIFFSTHLSLLMHTEASEIVQRLKNLKKKMCRDGGQ